MMTQLQILLNKFLEERGNSVVIAKACGCGAPKISKLKNNYTSEFKDFALLIKIAKFLSPEKEFSLMTEYASHLDPNKKTARNMLEYLSCNRLLADMEILLKKMETCENDESREYAAVYKLLHIWQTKYHQIDSAAFLEDLNKVHVTEANLKLAVKIMKCNVYYQKLSFNMALELSLELFDDLDNIEESYIKTAYETKINEIHSYLNLWVTSDYEQAREYANKVLSANIGQTFNAYANFIIGCTYFYDSFENAIMYLEKGKLIYDEIERNDASNDVNERIELLYIFWNRENEYPEFKWNVSNFLIKTKQGIKIQNELAQAQQTIKDVAFYTFLSGLEEKSMDKLLLSVIQFVKNGDSFNAKLPKQKLLEHGFNELVLNELINIHIK